MSPTGEKQEVSVPILDLMYESPGGERRHFLLDEARTIQAANGDRLGAYPLIVANPDDSEPARVLWLDSNLLVVRFDSGCWASGSASCTHQSVTWNLEGLPWIVGLDTGLAIASGIRPGYSSWGQEVDALPALSRTETHTVASFSSEADARLRIPFAGVMEFARGAIHPRYVNVHLGEETVATELHLVSANVTPRQAVAEESTSHRALELATSAAPGRLFVDETEDTFEIGHSHASLMDQFLEEFDEAAAMLDAGGCLIDYSLWPAEPQGVLSSLANHKIASMALRVLASDSNGKRWEIDVFDGPGGLALHADEETEFSTALSCEDVGDLAIPALPVRDFLAHASTYITRHIGVYGFQVVREPMPGGEAGTAMFGTRYTAYFEPEAGVVVGGAAIRKSPYQFSMHAEAERIRDATFHPADFENFS